MTTGKERPKIIDSEELKALGSLAPSATRAWRERGRARFDDLNESAHPGGGSGLLGPKARTVQQRSAAIPERYSMGVPK